MQHLSTASINVHYNKIVKLSQRLREIFVIEQPRTQEQRLDATGEVRTCKTPRPAQQITHENKKLKGPSDLKSINNIS